jgi:energy-coupling factor transporter transmembrane protein EcfT
MTRQGDRRPIAPSSRLALYLAAVVSLYVLHDPAWVISVAMVLLVASAVILRRTSRPVPGGRWRGALLFIGWVFVMRVALDLVAGVSPRDPEVWLVAGRQAARVAVLSLGVIVLIATTPARDVVDELEHSRLPRAVRLLVMMLVQYPRVLRDRYAQIVEAQVARGGDRPRSAVQRVSHGFALLLPVMQSELNAVGERAGLMHIRGLDLEVPRDARRSARSTMDIIALVVAAAAIAITVGVRLSGR